MAVRIPPHILSVINWKNAFHDPIRRQFIPLEATSQQDHPKLKFDSLHEEDDSPVPGLVHRYPDKVLFLGKFTSSTCSLLIYSNFRSNLCLPTLLPILYSILCYRCGYWHAFEKIAKASQEPLATNIRTYPQHSGYPRRGCFRGRLLPAYRRANRHDR